jgi:adenylosuccinate synthase
LDVDFGSFPFVTSSNTVTAAVCTGLGIAPSKIGKVYGVFKAYCTRVGSGPFPSELFDDIGQRLRDNGHEYGSTTGRPRRCGWLDLPALKYAIMIDGVTDLIITKADVMDDFDEINICTSYEYQSKKLDYLPYEIAEEDMQPQYTALKGWKTNITEITELTDIPQELQDYIKFVEDTVDTPITVVSTGPDRKQTMIK